MVLARNSVVKRAIRDGVVNRGMLRICNITKSFDNGIIVSPAQGFVDFLKGMDVVREEYMRKGLVKENRALFLYNEGLIDENSTLLLARKEGQVVGTISVITGKDNKMPCSKLFSDELLALNLQCRKVTEVGTLSVKQNEGTDKLVFMLYLKTMMYAIFIDRVDDIFIQVKEKTASFYIRNLLFKKIGQTKIHPDYKDIKVCLLRVDVKAIREKIYEQRCYGSMGWVKILCELGLLTEYKSVCNQCQLCEKFSLDQKDAEVYHYLCHL